MNRNHLSTALCAAILSLSAGAAFSANGRPAGNTRAGNAGAQPGTQASATIARRSLRLQPGDESIIISSLGQPIRFTQVPNERTFTGQLIVHAKAGRKARAADRVSPLTLKASSFVDEYVVDVPAGMSEGELASVLLATGDYEFVEPNWLRYPEVIPNDSQYNSSWQHTRLDSAEAWDLNTGSSDVIVAVCDSGVDLDHPDLVASLVSGYNAASNRAQDNGGDVQDINGHGTFVSGCAAARGNNGTGVVGVGWNFSIMPVRVTNNTNGTASSFDILEGARWAAEHGAKVINASFSGGTSGSNQTTGAYLKSQGALLFWASGNDNAYVTPNRPDYVMVGATTSSDRRSSFSNYGPAVDVTAPGSGVRSTQNGGGYGNSSGTSFASPIAAGVGAMIYSVNDEFSADDVQDILYHSVDDLGDPGRDDYFGRGRVNTHNAVLLAQGYVRPILTPLAESFEDAGWQDIFISTSGVAETMMSPDAPDGGSVLVLDNDDAIETVALAGRSLSGNPLLSFKLRSESIETGESLDVQYLEDPDVLVDTWTTLASINGQGLTSQQFVAYDIELPNGYKWHGVKLRFVSNGSDASDTWMIDGLSIDSITDPVAPLADNFESGLISAVRWADAENAGVAYEGGRFFATLGDASTLESRDIPLAQFGIVPGYIRFDASVDESVGPDDTLRVEVLNIAGSYQLISTIPASDLSGDPRLIEIDMPFTAIGIDGVRLRLSASTTGAFEIDNVYLGVDELGGPCNGADLAEPYDVLNFFDISAYLSAFSAGDLSADITGDGTLNFFDISGFLSVYSQGCP